MKEQIDMYDMLGDEGLKYKPIKSTDWKWRMSKDYPTEKNGLKVFSCFACGGGSTMGYKLAGCEVIGCNEIDPKINEVYVRNHNPKYNFLMDIRKFNQLPKSELPDELFNLDILDGSPPCTTFSNIFYFSFSSLIFLIRFIIFSICLTSSLTSSRLFSNCSTMLVS